MQNLRHLLQKKTAIWHDGGSEQKWSDLASALSAVHQVYLWSSVFLRGKSYIALFLASIFYSFSIFWRLSSNFHKVTTYFTILGTDLNARDPVNHILNVVHNSFMGSWINNELVVKLSCQKCQIRSRKWQVGRLTMRFRETFHRNFLLDLFWALHFIWFTFVFFLRKKKHDSF